MNKSTLLYHVCSCCLFGAEGGNRTRNLRITKALPCHWATSACVVFILCILPYHLVFVLSSFCFWCVVVLVFIVAGVFVFVKLVVVPIVIVRGCCRYGKSFRLSQGCF